MTPVHTTWMRAGVAVAALLVGAASAQAGGFANRQQSVNSQGSSYSGMAAVGGGISGMFWNPSLVTSMPGRNTEVNLSFIIPDSNIKTESGTVRVPPGVTLPLNSPLLGANRGTLADSGNIGIPTLTPATYNNYQVNERLWIGLSNGSPFGFRTKADEDFAARVYGASTKALSINVTPTAGYKVNEWLSIGAGLQLQYLKVDLKTATSLAPNSNVARLEGDNFSVGYTLGATFTPFAGTSIGVGFRSSVRHELEGSFSTPTGAFERIKATVNLPEIVTMSIRQQITEQLDIMGSVQWSNWSRVKNPPINSRDLGGPSRLLANSVPGPFLPFQYDDEWFFSLGAEYRINPQWTVRGGVAYEISPVSDRVRNVRLTDNDRLWLSVGAGYKFNEKLSFDVGYTHIFVKDTPINISAASGNPSFNGSVTYVGKAKPSIDIISVSLKYRWDDPAPAPARAVVKKF